MDAYCQFVDLHASLYMESACSGLYARPVSLSHGSDVTCKVLISDVDSLISESESCVTSSVMHPTDN